MIDLHEGILEEFADRVASAHAEMVRRDENSSLTTISYDSWDWTAHEAKLENPAADAYLDTTIGRCGMSEDEILRARQAIESGASIREVAKDLQRGFGAICSATKDIKRGRRGRPPLDAQKVAAIREYAARGSLSKRSIARLVGVNEGTVRRILR